MHKYSWLFCHFCLSFFLLSWIWGLDTVCLCLCFKCSASSITGPHNNMYKLLLHLCFSWMGSWRSTKYQKLYEVSQLFHSLRYTVVCNERVLLLLLLCVCVRSQKNGQSQMCVCTHMCKCTQACHMLSLSCVCACVCVCMCYFMLLSTCLSYKHNLFLKILNSFVNSHVMLMVCFKANFLLQWPLACLTRIRSWRHQQRKDSMISEKLLCFCICLVKD